jgi:hypothetical protein
VNKGHTFVQHCSDLIIDRKVIIVCKDANEYQKELIRQSSAILADKLAENGNALSKQSVDELQGIVLSQIQDVVDISLATNEAEKLEIMNRYL